MARTSPSKPERPATTNARPSRLPRLLALAIVLFTAIAYATSFSGTFVFDDERQILQNPEVTEYPIAKLIDKSTRPVVNLSLALDYRLAGGPDLESLDDLPSTTPFHLTNLIIHTLAALTLFALIRRTLLLPSFSTRFSPRSAALIAFALSTLWALHPLNTQSVTYIVQRAESLMGLFYLLTLYTLLRAATAAGRASLLWSAACVAACALGMGSKAVMLTAPIAALLYDHTFLATNALDALKKRWPLYLGLAATWTILALVGIVSGVFDPHPNASPTLGFTIDKLTPAEYFFTQPEVILHYIKLALLPLNLTIDYAWPVQTNTTTIAVTTAALSALGLLTLWQLSKRTWIGFVGAFFFLVLATTSSIVPINDLAFEHRMYLPLISVVILASAAVYAGLNKITTAPANAAAILLTIAAIALGSLTASRNLDYASGLALWQDTAAKRPTNPRAIVNQASMLARDERYAEAIPLYERALELNEQSADTHTKYARALARAGDRQRAITHFKRALELDPSAISLNAELAREHVLTNQLPTAVVYAQRALDADPENSAVMGDLLVGLIETQRFDQALPLAERLSALQPDNPVVTMYLGRAQAGAGDLAAAAQTLERAVVLDPTNLRASIELANVHERRNRLFEAVEALRRVTELRMSNPDADLLATVYFNLGNLTYAYRDSQGDPRSDIMAECIELYTKAIELRPNYASAHYGLGWAYRLTGKRDLALKHLRECLRLQPTHRRARADLDAIESTINQNSR